MNDLAIALQSGAILLREGVEAMLVIGGLAAFLTRAGARAQVKALYVGAAAAIAASLAAAVVFATFFNGAHDDRVEALVMGVAAVLMLYMSGWLFLKQDTAAWTAELKRIADRSLASPGSLSLAGVAFLAVFREGAETILFVQALANSSGGWSAGLLGGLAGAAALLVALFYAMQWLALRLPLRPVFLATSALLFVMGLRFIGAAMQELQEQTILSYTPAPFDDVVNALGFNPSIEALAVQGVVVLAALVGALSVGRARRAARPVAAPAE